MSALFATIADMQAFASEHHIDLGIVWEAAEIARTKNADFQKILRELRDEMRQNTWRTGSRDSAFLGEEDNLQYLEYDAENDALVDFQCDSEYNDYDAEDDALVDFQCDSEYNDYDAENDALIDFRCDKIRENIARLKPRDQIRIRKYIDSVGLDKKAVITKLAKEEGVTRQAIHEAIKRSVALVRENVQREVAGLPLIDKSVKKCGKSRTNKKKYEITNNEGGVQ